MMAAFDHFLQGSSGKSTRGLLRIIILLTIAAAAVSARLFSVIREYTAHDANQHINILYRI